MHWFFLFQCLNGIRSDSDEQAILVRIPWTLRSFNA